jgi:2-keto-4-pentenoate hydratase/2-oxohepta-3-ene-1,7-dioic acid hydratase in catechol pathway
VPSEQVVLLQTRAGIGRLTGADVELLETDVPTLDAAIRDGALGSLAAAPARATVPLAEADVSAPVQEPERFVLVGRNYRAHADELGWQTEPELKFLPVPAAGTLTQPGAPVPIPPEHADTIDYEGEFAIVIGAPADAVDASAAWDVVAGVAAANDVSARGAYLDTGPDGEVTIRPPEEIVRAKTFPGFKPLGAALLVTGGRAPDGDLAIRTLVNGELRQHATLDDMMFSVADIVAGVSARLPLRPGDVILTGSPGGIGMATGDYLRPGDVVEVQVGSLPPLRNTFV